MLYFQRFARIPNYSRKRPNFMTNSKKTKQSAAHKRLNLANIVQRLPFHQRLSDSQSLILKVTPIWHEWCEQQRNRKGSKQFAAAADTRLTSFDNGVLTLACNNTSTATILKHKNTSLLVALQKAGFEQIKRIRVQMALSKTANPASENFHSHNSYRASSGYQPERHFRDKPSDSSIKSLEAVHSRIENEQLASALQRLAETLKKQ